MPKVNFVKKARKDIEDTEIKKGDSYYWWQPYRSGKRYSKTRPKASQTVGSAYLQQLYSVMERQQELSDEGEIGDLEAAAEEFASELEEMADECEDKLNNMPEGLQQGPTGEQLQARADACRQAADSFREIDFDIEDGSSEETIRARKEDILGEIQAVEIEEC